MCCCLNGESCRECHPVDVGALLASCTPGRHFQGLWITRHRETEGFAIRWWVTFRDRAGEYQETDLHETAEAALRACREALG